MGQFWSSMQGFRVWIYRSAVVLGNFHLLLGILCRHHEPPTPPLFLPLRVCWGSVECARQLCISILTIISPVKPSWQAPWCCPSPVGSSLNNFSQITKNSPLGQPLPPTPLVFLLSQLIHPFTYSQLSIYSSSVYHSYGNLLVVLKMDSFSFCPSKPLI